MTPYKIYLLLPCLLKLPYCGGQESSKDGFIFVNFRHTPHIKTHLPTLLQGNFCSGTDMLSLNESRNILTQARNGHQTSHKKENNASPEFFLSQFITKIPNVKCCYTLVFRWFKLWHCRSSTHKFLSHRIIDPIVPRERSIIQFLDSAIERKSQIQNKCNKATNSNKI